ncbi:MAG: cupin domain-containing protein [Coxiellaceae bacterium]|nr:cupin domain-containing protein [Coxiellaceae bacterium]
MKVNINDVEVQTQEQGDFSYQRQSLTHAAGGKALGASIFTLQTGKKAFPYHYHYANEEAILVLEGEGTLRCNDEMIPLIKGDYIALPVGEEHAHQMINTSGGELKYLCFSTMIDTEICGYPDSDKLCAMAGAAPGGDKVQRKLMQCFKQSDNVDYFYDES